MKVRLKKLLDEAYSKILSSPLNNPQLHLQAQYMLADGSLLLRNKLEDLGENIDAINSKRNTTMRYRPADLSQRILFDKNNSLATHLLENYAHISSEHSKNTQKLLKSLLPNSSFDKVVDMLFEQIALTAESWSQQDLIGECRFAGLSMMSAEERLNLARQVANQNRSLATLGGSVNLFGLVGIFIDSVWLLLVSLRTVYQIAEIHGQPLTGKEGLQVAYATLSSCNLDQLKDKQTLLTSLAIASRMLINSDKQGLPEALAIETKSKENIGEFVAHIADVLSKAKIDLDKVNFSLMGRTLPVAAATAGIHFNSLVIEEVIGVANATFAPDIKMVTCE